jgi:DHA1 family bicyclomycin/chloramphenicol resistance-like MFS transporter
MISTYARNAIVLGLLAAVGPFAIDMYVPALPTIAADLGATTAATQMTLMTFFIGFGLSQIIYGPVSDMVGRKAPLYFGLALYIVGGIGCALSPSIDALILFRLVQGVGAASVMVIPRAIIRDLHTGIEATRLMSLVMLVLSVSPILAPLAGSGLIILFGWRAVFVVATLVALVSVLLVTFALPETWPKAKRLKTGIGTVLSGYGQLLRDPRFLGLTFIGGLGFAGFFAFLASSSFIYMDHYGLTPALYGLAFSANAVGFIGASQFSAKLGEKFGMGRVVSVAVTLHALFAVALFAVTLAGVDSLAVLMVFLFLAFACLGLVIPATMVLALDDHGPIAGMASALGGTLQMVAGGILIVVVSYFYDGTSLPMVTTIALCAVGAFILARLTLGQDVRATAPAE